MTKNAFFFRTNYCSKIKYPEMPNFLIFLLVKPRQIFTRSCSQVISVICHFGELLASQQIKQVELISLLNNYAKYENYFIDNVIPTTKNQSVK